MPTFFELRELTPARLAAALSFVLEGKAVGFGTFSLTVIDHELIVYIEYPMVTPDDALARELVQAAASDLELLLEREGSFDQSLRGLPRRFLLIRSMGNVDAEIGEVRDNQPTWRI